MRGASSSRCSSDQAALACTVQRSMPPRPGLDDSRASQAMRWWVLRAAFHCGPMRVAMACGKASISVQHGATSTLAICCAMRGSSDEACSRACACGLGMASITPSKPEKTCCASGVPGVPVVRSCHCWRFSASRSMRVTWVSSSVLAASGCAQRRTSAFMPGEGTQCGSRAASPAAATRPKVSSTRTVVALQGRLTPLAVSSASAKRGSRTVKYCAPWSKLPKALSRVAIRPATPALFSNTVTRWPACSSVRAQVIPAMPAPMTAKCFCPEGVSAVSVAGGRNGLVRRVIGSPRLIGFIQFRL